MDIQAYKLLSEATKVYSTVLEDQCAKYAGHSNLAPEYAAMQSSILQKSWFLTSSQGRCNNKYRHIITKFGSSVVQYQAKKLLPICNQTPVLAAEI